MCSYFQQIAAREKAKRLQRRPIINIHSDTLRVIRPSLMAETITATGEAMRHWSLIPAWAQQCKLKYATFNARAESLRSKPAYRDAWHRSQRCLIPAASYSEYPLVDGVKQRHDIARADAQELMLAGLWSDWQQDDECYPSFTMITTSPIAQIEWVHSRSPLMLAESDWDRWLHGSAGQCEDLLQARDFEELSVVKAQQDQKDQPDLFADS